MFHLFLGFWKFFDLIVEISTMTMQIEGFTNSNTHQFQHSAVLSLHLNRCYSNTEWAILNKTVMGLNIKKSFTKLKVSWLSCQKVTSSFNNGHSNLSFHHQVHAHNLKNVNCIVFLSPLPHTKTHQPQTTQVK